MRDFYSETRPRVPKGFVTSAWESEDDRLVLSCYVVFLRPGKPALVRKAQWGMKDSMFYGNGDKYTIAHMQVEVNRQVEIIKNIAKRQAEEN